MARGDGGTSGRDAREEAPEVVEGLGDAVPKAPEGTRYIGFCRECRDFVELGPTFACMKGGHKKSSISVAVLVGKDDHLPHMPRLNIGALFMPAIWGPAHGQWYMILFYPIWLLMDNLIYGAVHGTANAALAVVAVAAAAWFTVFYALHANAYAYQRVAAEKTPEEFIASERRWSVLFVAIGVAFLAFATWYNLAVRPGL